MSGLHQAILSALALELRTDSHRHITPTSSAADRLCVRHTAVHNTFKTTILLAALGGLLIVIGGALGGTTGMLVAFVVAALLNVSAYWFSGDVALRMAGAREVTPAEAPELHRLVAELASYAQLPTPRVAIIDSPSPNAFATGRDPQHAVVAVTTGILDLLTRDELAGVLAHELGHVRNRDILVSSLAATLAGAVTLLANLAQWSLLLGGSGRSGDDEQHGNLIGGFLTVMLAPLAATLIQLAVSRSREFGADATGAAIHGQPESLARALEKLELGSRVRPLEVNPAAAHLFVVNPLTGGGFSHLFSTHPPVSERIRRLRQMPASALVA
jgi:heat shock protein HtpX